MHFRTRIDSFGTQDKLVYYIYAWWNGGINSLKSKSTTIQKNTSAVSKLSKDEILESMIRTMKKIGMKPGRLIAQVVETIIYFYVLMLKFESPYTLVFFFFIIKEDKYDKLISEKNKI